MNAHRDSFAAKRPGNRKQRRGNCEFTNLSHVNCLRHTAWLLVAALACLSWDQYGGWAEIDLGDHLQPSKKFGRKETSWHAQAPPTQALPPTVPLFDDRRRLKSCGQRKKVRRTREDIRREQQALLEKTQREIDALATEFHAKLPQEKADAIGAIYARYSSRFQDSIADQVRTLFEAAHQQNIFIPRDHVFFDLAVRGWKDRRPGLTSLRDAIKRKSFQVFLVFTTSRLFRRTYKAMQFVEEEIVERGIRGIFVKSNLDTADGENWRTMFQLFAAMDEAMVRMYGSHVQAAHEGLFIRGMVCMTLPLGYTGEDVPGEFTKQKRPRRKIVIDPETARWIKRIF
jgi:DNA invertase Pin-like site-specific DNA recombinase